MKVAVVGTGLMGMGIAQVFATHGDEVMMCIVTGKDPEGKKAKFAKGFTRLVQKGKMTQEEVDEIMGRVTFGGLDIAADADLVVESALEDMDAKIEVFKKLDEICKPETMFTTNPAGSDRQGPRDLQGDRQGSGSCTGRPRLRRQPHPDPDDQRGYLHLR